jgi:hypothetical protein
MPHGALVIVGVLGDGKIAVMDQSPAQETDEVFVEWA